MILKRLETVIRHVFQSSVLRNDCFIDNSIEKCDITPERCRPVTFSGAITLDVVFLGLNGKIPIMCFTPKDKIIMT